MPEKFEGHVPPQEHETKTETQEAKVESKDLTPEQMAQDLTSSYWSKRLGENQSSMEDPNIRVQGGDFDTARCQAYLEKIREGKFFDEVDVSGTYDGEPTRTTESSAYDFFKKIADSTDRRIELFKDNPELVEKYKPSWEQTCKAFVDPYIYQPCKFIFLSYSDEDYCEEQFELLEIQTIGLNEEELLEIYRPLCEELTNLSQGPEWNSACQMVLQYPDGVCLENMQDLGINLTDEEKADCLAKVQEVTKQRLVY